MNLDLRILIIDDQRPNLDLVEQLLAREGLLGLLAGGFQHRFHVGLLLGFGLGVYRVVLRPVRAALWHGQ